MVLEAAVLCVGSARGAALITFLNLFGTVDQPRGELFLGVRSIENQEDH